MTEQDVINAIAECDKLLCHLIKGLKFVEGGAVFSLCIEGASVEPGRLARIYEDRSALWNLLRLMREETGAEMPRSYLKCEASVQ